MEDITTKNLYSMPRAGTLLTQAIYEELVAAGWTEAEALEWLASKQYRWLLDGQLGNELRALAEKVAKQVTTAQPDLRR